jgi:hypothetical protein
MADSLPADLAALSAAEHLAHAHAHTVAAGQHADLAATHIHAASDGTTSTTVPDEDSSDGTDGRSAAMASPAAGYAQNRTGFAAGTGAARAYRAATGRR